MIERSHSRQDLDLPLGEYPTLTFCVCKNAQYGTIFDTIWSIPFAKYLELFKEFLGGCCYDGFVFLPSNVLLTLQVS